MRSGEGTPDVAVGYTLEARPHGSRALSQAATSVELKIYYPKTSTELLVKPFLLA